jgi:hypothetical protein
MDSSVYKYLIEKLQFGTLAASEHLSLYFAKHPVDSASEAFKSLVFFLGNLTSGKKASDSVLPELLLCENSFFRTLFLASHHALADVVSGQSAETHEFRTNGVQLVRFLTFCVRDDGPLFIQHPGPEDCAMLCFLTEGLMHAGWCPNACEREAKRAAHAYFIELKKSLHRAKPEAAGTILGYLWCSWLLAQKTEGIKSENQQPGSDIRETFTWKSETGPKTFIAQKTVRPGLFYIIERCNSSLPHPCESIVNVGSLGLCVRLNHESVRPANLSDFSEINRRKIFGHKFVYECGCGLILGISWTIVILMHENTVFRIDSLNFPDKSLPYCVAAEMRLESGSAPQKSGRNSFISKGVENTVVRFLDSPLEFEFDRTEKNFRSLYKASIRHDAVTLKLVTGRATGRGISSINETNLLGIYD